MDPICSECNYRVSMTYFEYNMKYINNEIWCSNCIWYTFFDQANNPYQRTDKVRNDWSAVKK